MRLFVSRTNRALRTSFSMKIFVADGVKTLLIQNAFVPQTIGFGIVLCLEISGQYRLNLACSSAKISNISETSKYLKFFLHHAVAGKSKALIIGEYYQYLAYLLNFFTHFCGMLQTGSLKAVKGEFKVSKLIIYSG